MYYRLLPEIYLIKGVKNFILSNVLTGEIISLDAQTGALIESAEKNQSFNEEPMVFKRLCEMGWMQKKGEPVFVEKLRFTNVFNKRRAWKFFPQIQNLILQISNRCNTNCSKIGCENAFCPSCLPNDQLKQELSFDEWKQILDNLKNLNPESVILTGGNPTLHKNFTEIHAYASNMFEHVFVTVSDVDILKKLPNNSNVNLLLFHQKDAAKFRASDYSNLNVVPYYNKDTVKVKEGIPVNFGDVTFQKTSFQKKLSFAEQFIRRMYDSCLTGKITVLCDGTLVPCMGCKDDVIGNLLKEDMAILMRKLYHEYWEKDVDQQVGRKCLGCEYRYNCSSCIKMKDHQCGYNIEEGIWNS